MNISSLSHFSGSDAGEWHVISQRTVSGAAIPPFARLAIGAAASGEVGWQARGFSSNLRYTAGHERRELDAHAAPANRGDRCAVLIPMSKNAAWWAMAQDERLAVFARSRHMRIGKRVLPAVYRKLYHCRDLGEAFDFLTWFEFAAEAETAFDTMVSDLRASEEWDYVCAESEIRLRR